MENPVLNILSRIDASTLPAVPRVLLDLIHATHKDDVSFKELSQIIGQDASLSSKVLATANSPYYRQWGEINDLNRVITVLGLNTIKTIAITRTVQQYFSQIPQIHYDFLEIIWYRSLTCAYLAHRLAKLTTHEFPDEAYLTGLIHRIGQLVFLKCFPKEYPYFLTEYLDHQTLPLEKQTFGATHQEVGSHLLSTWKIPASIPDAVLYQSYPVKAIAASTHLVKLINLASQLSSMNNKNKDKVFALADALFGLNQPLLEELLEEVKSLVEQSAASLGIIIASPEGSDIKCLTPKSQRTKIQKNVADYIRDMALTSAIRQQFEPSTEINHLVATFQRDMNVLFGLQVAAVVLIQPETNSLVATLVDPSPDASCPTFSVDAVPDQSVLAKARFSQQLLFSFDSDKTVPDNSFDRQLLQKLGSDGLLLIPLWNKEKSVGVIVSGLSQSEVAAVESKTDFIKLFAHEAAQAFVNTAMHSNTSSQTADHLTVNFQLHARKLVHEANNPLSIINNYLYLLRKKLGEDHSDEIRIIQEEIDRVSTIILRLPDGLEYNAREEKKLVAINDVIVDLIHLFQPGIFKTYDIKTVLKLDDDLPEISSSRCKLKQILTNLIKNSAEAMPSGGTLSISTQDQIKFRGNDYVEIRVQDTGPGLPREVISHLFSPVTSTKGHGHSGLGLTICKNLVDELKGAIHCESSSSNGTTFRILLPRKPG